MATYTFDGTQNITATNADTVVIIADPTTFTQAVDNGSSVSLGFGANTLTITGTTLFPGNLSNVSISGGKFTYLGTTNTGPGTATNELAIVVPNGTTYNQTVTTTASSKVAVFGGLGRFDSVDGDETISIGGKGNFFIHGDGGNDRINNDFGAFDSTSVVNVFADQGNDGITFSASTKASIYAGGGVGADTITVAPNTGTTFLQGGLDSADAADVIFYAFAGGAAGTSYIYGNGGDDTISVGQGTPIDPTSTSAVIGGYGNDTIQMNGTKATLTVIGGEGLDTITVNNTGSTYITGGNPSGADQSLDGADSISFNGSGSTYIFGNVGNDTIGVTVGNATDTTNISIYGGKGGDVISQFNGGAGKSTVFIAGGEDGDTIFASGNGGGITIWGGISNSDTADGSDSITLSDGSTGSNNIFANAGNDTVLIGVLGTDTSSTTTVYGGGGADSISALAQDSGAQALVLYGNEGPDTFAIAAGKGQTVTVGDFKVSDGDSLKLSGLGAAGSLKVATGSFQTLQQALDAAATKAGANGAAAVAFNGNTYVVLESGGAQTTYSDATAQAIKLTGVTDASTLVPVTTVTA